MHECAAVVATPLPHDDESTKHLARLREDNNGAAVPRVKVTTSESEPTHAAHDDGHFASTEFEYDVSFDEVKIGLSLEVIHPNVVRVKDTSGPASTCGCIQVGDVLVRVHGHDIAHDRFAQVMLTLKSAPRPLHLHFRRPMRAVELPPNFELDREHHLASAWRPNDMDSVCACHEEDDEGDDDSNVDTAHDDSYSLPGSSISSRQSRALRRAPLQRTDAPCRQPDAPENDGEGPLPTRAPSSLAAQWKSITDWSFGLTKLSPPPPSIIQPFDDFQTAMLSLRIEPPTASLLPATPGRPTPSEDGAALLLRWQPCVGAKTYHLQQSRDWPVKVWKQCSTTPIQPSVRQTDHPAGDAEVPTDMALLECVVYGLDFSRSYVFRVRCALESGACGDFSDASDAITTSPKAPNAQSPVKMSGACIPTPPADVALVYHSDFEGDSNAMSLVVTWTAVPHATAYQVQWMRHGQRLVWRNSPELSAWEVAVDQPSPERVENETAAAAAAPTMQYMLQGLASCTEYVVRIRAACRAPTAAVVWGDFSAWSSPLATIASEEDLMHARDALARKEAAMAVVDHIKNMANSVKEAVGGRPPATAPASSNNAGLFAQVCQLYKS
ncbi:hypothetical protein H310_06591 [Aphanomyces invadans]|uniref:PDZ domain-containing protein n=1 Tax=Aphanomyces invadans TaxID=157072 RepID=A0A024U5T3_9STRA|nr:hypothetical protein H310_06591 [Aphanomyces invadans]ETW00938.1 hypothetical protein H310_06591 [Aphanomyces invadans]|eukprot:XP_008869936.1 hypothetical protein H310_06591 [Aphanomyces invadans]